MSKAKLNFEVHVYSNYDPMVLERYHDGRQLKTVSLYFYTTIHKIVKKAISKNISILVMEAS